MRSRGGRSPADIIAWLLLMEGSAQASGRGAAAFVAMFVPLVIATLFGLLGLGLLLVAKEHRRLFVGMYLGCIVAAQVLDRWLPSVVVAAVAFAPILLAIYDRGGWKGMALAALGTPLVLLGYRHVFDLASTRSVWLLPLASALPLVPFVVACWASGKRRLAAATIPSFLAGAYLFFATMMS